MTGISREDGRDHITIMAPDGTVRTVPLGAPDVSVGRGAENDIVLDYASISRQHARIQFDGASYRVVDLNSASGTFVGDVRLLPGVPEPWPPDKAVRVGDCWLRLERARADVRPSREAAATSATAQRGSASRPPVAAFMEAPDLSVDPGASVTATVTVLNQGPVVDHLHVSVTNLPADWLPGPVPVIRLLPGAQEAVRLVIAPPRTPTSRASVYPLTIRVVSQDAPDQFAEVQARLTVNPYAQFQAELRPQTVRAGRLAQVRVQNQGNAPQTYSVSCQDRAEELAFAPTQQQLTVPEGQAGTAEFRARPRSRPLIGGQKSHSYTAEVASPGGEKQVLNGQATSRGLIPKWLPPLALVLLLGCAALLVVPYLLGRKPPTIDSVTIDPASPVAGQAVTVRWSVENAESIDLTPLVAGLDPERGGYTITGGLPASTSLTLVAHNQYGSSERSLAVTVRARTPTPEPTATPTAEPGAPLVQLFEVTPATVFKGQQVTVRWSVQGAESVEIDPFGTVEESGEETDLPQETMRYKLTATNKGKTVSRSVQVVVGEPPTETPTFQFLIITPAPFKIATPVIPGGIWQLLKTPVLSP